MFGEANLRATPILDYLNPRVLGTLERVQPYGAPELPFLRGAHQFLCREVKPVYTVDELQPASVTLAKGKGSCSQRFACLEALARARGIATRVRGLWITGKFWAPRFRFAHHLIPQKILLAWPQFLVEGNWLSAESLHGELATLAEKEPRGFTNDAETLFDAVAHTAVDFDGQTASCVGGVCNLSSFTEGDAGIFGSRDELFQSQPLFQRTFRGRAFEMIYGGRKSA